MFGAENFSFSFSAGAGWIILGTLILLGFSIYYYRFTIPPVSSKLKTLLILLRFIALVSIFILLFAPELFLVKTLQVKPLNVVFVDNSNSMVRNDSIKTRERILSLLNDFQSAKNFDSKILLFDKSVNEVNLFSSDSLRFNGKATNYERLFNKIENVEDSASNIIIISDGNPTEGSVPTNFSEKISTPIFTVGVGDSILPPNVELGHIVTNHTVYKGEKTFVDVAVLSSGIKSETGFVSLYLNGRFVEKKKILFTSDGFVKIRLSYKPVRIGINSLRIAVGKSESEKNFSDNIKQLYVRVLKKKKNVLLLTSSPDFDFEFIKRALLSDSNLVVKDFVKYSDKQSVSFGAIKQNVDSSDVLFLINFPTHETSEKIWSIVSAAIKNGKPFYLQVTAEADLSRISQLREELPFRFKSFTKSYFPAQPAVVMKADPIFSSSGIYSEDIWNNLSPVDYVKTNISISSAASTLLEIKKGNKRLNFPLLISAASPVKSFTLFADGIWKWKLKTDLNQIGFFDSFFVNSVKWLTNRKNEGRVKVYLSKSAYKKNESVFITAEVFDKLFNHSENAEVTGIISNGEFRSKIIFRGRNRGLYETSVSNIPVGKYNVKVKAKIGDEVVSGKAKFSVERFDAEKINNPMNKNYLFTISNETGGKFYNIENAKKLVNTLDDESKVRVKKKIEEVDLFPSDYLLIFIIFTFSVEWILRKRKSLM